MSEKRVSEQDIFKGKKLELGALTTSTFFLILSILFLSMATFWWIKAIQGINYGDNVRLHVRGIYSDYSHEGILQKIERGFVFLKQGQAHSYRKLVGIKKC